MAFAVLTYPEFSRPDAERIQAYRAQHDPRHKLVEPHVTLVFPTLAANERRLLDHVTQTVASFRSFRLSLRCALVVKDVDGPMTHVYLVPDEGFGALVRLHDRLYVGPLERAARLDVPYIPHVTVGSFERPEAAKSLADSINQQFFSINGTVGSIAIARHEAGKLATLASLRLRSEPEPMRRDRPQGGRPRDDRRARPGIAPRPRPQQG